MRLPDKSGLAGQAWLLPRNPQTPLQEASLATWLVHAPQSHPIWPYKQVCLAHLRPIPGFPDAYKHYPEAEYELTVLAINPETHPEPDPDKDPFTLLLPAEAGVQFHVSSDVDARRICEVSVECVVDGQLVPDESYRSMWDSFIEEISERFRARQNAHNHRGQPLN